MDNSFWQFQTKSYSTDDYCIGDKVLLRAEPEIELLIVAKDKTYVYCDGEDKIYTLLPDFVILKEYTSLLKDTETGINVCLN